VSVRDHGRAVLVMVVDHSGSVPGVTGTFVVVSEKGVAGTIGGGAAEKELVDRALVHDGEPGLVPFRHTPSEGGTLCSGLQVFAIISLTRDDEKTIEEIVDTLAKQGLGTLELSRGGIRFDAGVARQRRYDEEDGGWSLTEPLGLLDTLYIIGGGHVCLALSRVMATLPFRIIVLDNRSELPTMAANNHAHEMRVIELDTVAEHVEEGERSWVVIMTFGHIHDRQVLEGLLGKSFAYLGLMGSEAKVRQMYGAMKADGIATEDLESVRAPIGLSIGSHTPEEIAISIAAEIIAVRNRRDEKCPRSASV